MSTAGREALDLRSYRAVGSWPKEGAPSFAGDAVAVAVDAADRVYVFNRGPVKVAIFDIDGTYVGGWGTEDDFDMPHAIAMGVEDDVYLVDSRGSFVERRTLDGELLLRIGENGRRSEPYSGLPFNWPTDVAVHPATGDIFVTDGYYNARVHRFDSDGNLLHSWGEPGTEAGQFCCPHGVCLLGGDRLAVADRENFRVQVFTLDGEYVSQWHCFHPNAIRTVPGGTELLVAELGPPALHHGVPNLGNRIAAYTPDGDLLGKIGAGVPGVGPDEFIDAHGLALDSSGGLYITQTVATFLTLFLQEPAPADDRGCVQKWVPAGAGGVG